MAETCRFCGTTVPRNVRCHEWQCPENPNGKTSHWEKFQATDQTVDQRAPADPVESGPPSPGQATQVVQDPAPTGGPQPRQYTPQNEPPGSTAQGPANPHATGDQEMAYKCGECGERLPGRVTYCPHCGEGPLVDPDEDEA